MRKKATVVIHSSFVHDALLQEALGNKVRCNTCERHCLIIPGGEGWCQTRENRGGKLVSLIYGAVSSLTANPIEKKPFYHFHPGTFALTAGSWSCNFGCPWCQNWDISKVPPRNTGNYLPPEKLIQQAHTTFCQGISISFNEPTLSLEWSLDVFRLARQANLYNTYVTNGYMTSEALAFLVEAGLDAMNVDVKSDAAGVRKYCKGIDMEKVWATCRLARLHGVHVEITTLVVPTVNDSAETLRGIAWRLASELGPDTPWHVSSYYPAYRFHAPPTPLSTLELAWQIGKKAGLNYVYIGNVPGHPGENTLCPSCGKLLIRRVGFDMLFNLIKDGCCPQCSKPIVGVWD